MEITLAAIALIIAGIALMYGHFMVCVAIIAGVAFGPVGWRYIENGDASLVYEFLFRVALFGIAWWAAHAYVKRHREIFESN